MASLGRARRAQKRHEHKEVDVLRGPEKGHIRLIWGPKRWKGGWEDNSFSKGLAFWCLLQISVLGRWREVDP